MLFLDLAPPTLQNSGIFHDSTRPHLHSDRLSPKSRDPSSLYRTWCVTSIITKKHSRSGLAWSRPGADRGLSRPTSVFRTTIGVRKIVSRSVEIWQYEGQNPCFWVKTENGQALAWPSIIKKRNSTFVLYRLIDTISSASVASHTALHKYHCYYYYYYYRQAAGINHANHFWLLLFLWWNKDSRMHVKGITQFRRNMTTHVCV